LYGSLVLLAIVLILAGIAIFLQSKSQSDLNATKSRISTKQDEIESLKDVERKASALTAKLSYVDQLLKNKIYYSKVMNELDLKSKSGITVTQVDVDEMYNVEIGGVSTSTTVLQTYINDLVKEPDNLFFDAKILEVSIKEGSGLASFKVSVKALKENLIKDNTTK